MSAFSASNFDIRKKQTWFPMEQCSNKDKQPQQSTPWFPAREVRVGHLPLGWGHPIRLQSMTSTNTLDTKATLAQCIRIAEAGADYVRISIPGKDSVDALARIRKSFRQAGFPHPLVADIHFNPDLALKAVPFAEKIRINPGNYVRRDPPGKTAWTEQERLAELDAARENLKPLAGLCRAHGTAIRIGVNLGSLSRRILATYGHSPEAMVASAMEFIRLFEELGFRQLVVSLKASDPATMVRGNILLVQRMLEQDKAYPLHLGVTEAGEGQDGRTASALGIVSLLQRGIGDTVRVSLTEAPESEIHFAKHLVAGFRKAGTAAIPSRGWRPREERAAPPLPSEGSIRQPAWDILSGSGFLFPGGQATAVLTSPGILPWKPEDHSLLTEEGLLSGRQAAHPHCNLLQLSPLPMRKANWPPRELAAALRKVPGLLAVMDHQGCASTRLAERLHRLLSSMNRPFGILLRAGGPWPEGEALIVRLAGLFGEPLLRRIICGIWLVAGKEEEAARLHETGESLLQAGGLSGRRTAYISCPTCARTSYDLEAVLKEIKALLPNLPGLKIAVMGCIVNGPGEMAGADFGVVGSGKGLVSIFQGSAIRRKNIPSEQAAKELLEVIISAGRRVGGE